MDKKTLRNDLILIGSLLLVAVISLIFVLTLKTKKNLQAKVYVQNNVVEVIDLSKKEEKDYYVNGLHGVVHIHTKNGGIAIVESGCPHQDCVNMGYVYETNRPIICAYNAVYIIIEGKANYDVEI
ncbi:MAG: NusG domain II-containing protein [Bacilli bacterium]|nr:NusG domain II-containing protein [Bacilli bacterium]